MILKELLINTTIISYRDDYFKCTSCKFTNCISMDKGGAINVDYRTKFVEISESLFFKCIGDLAGALNIKSTIIGIDSSCFVQCSSQKNGVFYLSYENATISSDGITNCNGKFKIATKGNNFIYKYSNMSKCFDLKCNSINNYNNKIDSIICYTSGASNILGTDYFINRIYYYNDFTLSEPLIVSCKSLTIENSLIYTKNISIQGSAAMFNYHNCSFNAFVIFKSNGSFSILNDTIISKEPELSKFSSSFVNYKVQTGNFTQRITENEVAVLMSSNIHIKEAVFIKLSSLTTGGAISLDFSLLVLNISRSLFYECNASTGGAVYASLDKVDVLCELCTYNCTAIKESAFFIKSSKAPCSYNKNLISISSPLSSSVICATVFSINAERIDKMNITGAKVYSCVLHSDQVYYITNSLVISKCESDDSIIKANCNLTDCLFIENTVNNRSSNKMLQVPLDDASYFAPYVVNTIFWKNQGIIGFVDQGKYENCFCDVIPEKEKGLLNTMKSLSMNVNYTVECLSPFTVYPDNNGGNKNTLWLAITCSVAGVVIIVLSIIVVVLRKRSNYYQKKTELSQNIISDFG